jgi:crotonobetainyl-CoA:carnitine CoA-transferase CaiB-like acyl-CoA transferase
MTREPGTTTRRALDDLRVVDLSTSVAAAWCGRLLADFGADVIVVEGADNPLRGLAPFDAEGRSILGRYVQANKRSLAIDWEQDVAAVVARLLDRADIVVLSAAPERLVEHGVARESVEREALLRVAVTPHGLSGPLASAPGNDLTHWARSGWASINGLADAPPLQGAGPIASIMAGVAAYGAVLAALHQRERGGTGDTVDVAELDAVAVTNGASMLRSLLAGTAQARPARVTFQTGPVPVADGHFALTLSRAHFWRDAMNELGLPDLAEDDEAFRNRRESAAQIAPRVEAKLSERTRADLFERLGELRVVAGPVLDMGELAKNEHLRGRDFFQTPDLATSAGGATEFPGAPFKMGATPWQLRRDAPALGEHSREVLAEAGFEAVAIDGLVQRGAVLEATS